MYVHSEQYSTVHLFLYNCQYHLARHACAIDDGPTVLIVGGASGDIFFKDVERYNSSGLVETLPSLNTARKNHGCSKYYNSAGEKVYLVVGGYGNYHDTWGTIDGTETLVEGRSAWTDQRGSLPVGLRHAPVLTMSNIPHYFGGQVRPPHSHTTTLHHGTRICFYLRNILPFFI